MPITTTLNRIRAHGPCKEGWEKLLRGLGKTSADDDVLEFAKILEINGLADALWCCCVEPQHDKAWRTFALWCAEQVAHLTADPRVGVTLDVVRRHIAGDATDEQMAEASWAASEAASEASRAASEASWAASWAASEESWAASWAASLAASRAASLAASLAASRAASEAASRAASEASRAAQSKKFCEIVSA